MIEINEADIRIEFYRAGGPGGQHRNTTESAVRIRHLPTGIVAQASESRSQHENRAVAMERLKRLLERREKKRKARIATRIPRREKMERLREKQHNKIKKAQRKFEKIND